MCFSVCERHQAWAVLHDIRGQSAASTAAAAAAAQALCPASSLDLQQFRNDITKDKLMAVHYLMQWLLHNRAEVSMVK